MHQSALVFVGAGIGGVARFWATRIIDDFISHDFPYGTLAINVTGCFLMGLLFVLLFEKFDTTHEAAIEFLLVGVLGGFTTFSAFSQQTFILFEKGAVTYALLNIFLSVSLCLCASFIGTILAKKLFI